MRRLYTGLAVLLIAVVVALYLSREAGYILIALGEWRVEISMVVFVALLALAGLLLYMILGTTFRIASVPGRMKRWSQRRKLARARTDLNDGLLQLLEGDYGSAQRFLTRRIERSDAPLVNYLAAAIAAQRSGDREARDRYLTAAERGNRRARSSVRLLQAQLQIEAGQWEEAQATLNHLLDRQPEQPRVLELMVACCEALGDWERLTDLLPRIRRQNVVPEERLRTLQRWVAREQITRGSARGPAALENAWKGLPRALRHDPELIGVYADGLITHGLVRAAEALLRKQLQKAWNEQFLRRYLQLPAGAQVMQQLEHWLRDRPEDPMLLYAAGVIALHQQLWGRARGYLEAAVSRAARPEYFRALGALQERLGELDAARESYRRAVELQAPGENLLGLPGPSAGAAYEARSEGGGAGAAEQRSTEAPGDEPVDTTGESGGASTEERNSAVDGERR